MIDVLYSNCLEQFQAIERTRDMLDMSTDLSPAFYCSCLLSSPAGKLLYIQMISAMELIAVSFGRELKDVHQHTYLFI